MKKTTLWLLQVCLIFISLSCVFSGIANQPQPDEIGPDEVVSDFDLWAQGIPTGIRLDSGKETLSNYREQGQVQIVGRDEKGVAIDGFQEYSMEIDRVNNARREIAIQTSPNPFLSGKFEWVDADGFSYYVYDDVHDGGRICEKEEIPADTSHFTEYHTMRILQTITPGEIIEENVRVNDVQADVYAIDNLSLLFARELHDVTGKVWIARQPSYLLKAEGTVNGEFEFQNNYYQGSATFSYEIKDFGQVQVQLPALCANPPEEMIPLPSNATGMVNFPEGLSYSSPDAADQLVSFYLDELTARGWQVEEVPSDFEEVLLASIHTQDGVEISAEITIHRMVEGSQVNIRWQADD